jgi:hypothetical protein
MAPISADLFDELPIQDTGTGARNQPASHHNRSSHCSVDAAALLAKDGYRGVGSESILIPGLAIQNKWVNHYGPQLDLHLVGNDKRSRWIGPRIEYRFDGYACSSQFHRLPA